jgi:hypothetical protein
MFPDNDNNLALVVLVPDETSILLTTTARAFSYRARDAQAGFCDPLGPLPKKLLSFSHVSKTPSFPGALS